MWYRSPMTPSPRKNCVTRNRISLAGFTLIEVLAALVIVAIGMLGAIQAVTQVAGNGAYIRDKSFANWIAMNRITEVRLATKPPEIGDSKGEVDYGGQRWRWSMNVSKTDVKSMLRIDMDVAPADAPDKAALASITGFYSTAIAPQPALAQWDLYLQQAGANPSTGGGSTPSTTPTTPAPIPTVPGSS
jgi:general secretion pathway protein I